VAKLRWRGSIFRLPAENLVTKCAWGLPSLWQWGLHSPRSGRGHLPIPWSRARPAPGLSAAVSGAHAFANAGTGPAVLNAKLGGKSGAPPAGQSEPPPKLSFTGDVGIPNNYTLDDVLRQQYRGPAAMDNDSIGGKLVNTIGALNLGIKVDY
jgi:hypothetical protein